MARQIDQLHVYQNKGEKIMAGRFPELDVRHKKDQILRYKRGNILEKSDKMYRYAQTFTIKGVERTLVMLTEDSKKSNVAKTFKDAVKQIETSDMIAVWNSATPEPKELNIYHVY